jgi:PAS domain S-box-containing protein
MNGPDSSSPHPLEEPKPEFFRLLVDSVKDYAIIIIDPEGYVLSWNAGAELVKGYRADEIIGKHFSIFYTPEDRKIDKPGTELQVAANVGRFEDEGWRVKKDGSLFWANVILTPLRDEDGTLRGYGKLTRDLTERKQMEETITRQSREILDASTPVVQMWEGVAVAPLIGTLDTGRAQQFTERLLEFIVAKGSPVALVDITGVVSIDTRTAQHLIEAITAVRLLGAQVVLTGVSPSIAQTLVHLGIGLQDVVTRASLAAGLRYALDVLGLEVVGHDQR